MDYNDVNSRLERLYSSIDKQYESDVLEHMQTKIEKKEGDTFTMTIDFNAKLNENEDVNRINSIIAGLANLKDHLKTKLKLKGGNPQNIEDEINNDLPLQLILDLNNQEKHGYPLLNKRSGKDPKITDISKGLSPKPGVIATAFIKDPITGAGHTNNMAIVITARVVDGDGNLLYYLSDLIDKTLNSWEAIIDKYNLK
ncbi:MAG: hypothetical protein PHI45_03070 [Candidatus Pacebacteria bacterium]|nr:hypothetical protein [Candidatus Paceibacterota bacterium]MDD5753035.1 hypothetical protein [Candidatus Paceibacterota bacterium]